MSVIYLVAKGEALHDFGVDAVHHLRKATAVFARAALVRALMARSTELVVARQAITTVFESRNES